MTNSEQAKQLASMVVRSIHQLGRVRDSLYLDTNAWSGLAKGRYDAELVRQWAETHQCYDWLSRCQLAELSADTRLAGPLAEIVRKLRPVFIDRELNEFSGEKWHKVKIGLEMLLILDEQVTMDEFVDQMTSGPIRQANQQLRTDAQGFEVMLQAGLQAVPMMRTRSWRELHDSMARWLNDHCARQGVTLHPDAVSDPERYVGIKLAFGVIFARYYLGGKTWNRSDYVDYLHCSDMAYAHTVVTEKNLAECIRQVTQRIPGLGPQNVHDLSWLTTLT